MPGIDEIDWSKVALPRDATPEQIIKQYEDAIDELVRLNREFERYFSNKMKKARVKMMTLNIFTTVNNNVSFDRTTGMIEMSNLLQFIANDDRPLYADVVKFVYQLFDNRPMNDTRLNRFKGLLIYYLCRVGF